MRTTYRYIALLLAMLALAFGAMPAMAQDDGDWNDVIADCNEDGDIDGNYSDEDLRRAENNLPTDIDEYTDCRDVIRDARTGGSRGSRTPPPTDDPALRTSEGVQAANQQDLDALRDVTQDRDEKARESAAVEVGGERVVPGAGDGSFKAARTAANELPLPVLLALAAIAALAAISTLLAARNRWPWIRRVAPRIFRR